MLFFHCSSSRLGIGTQVHRDLTEIRELVSGQTEVVCRPLAWHVTYQIQHQPIAHVCREIQSCAAPPSIRFARLKKEGRKEGRWEEAGDCPTARRSRQSIEEDSKAGARARVKATPILKRTEHHTTPSLMEEYRKASGLEISKGYSATQNRNC